MDLRFDSVLCSKLGNKNSDVGHIKWSCGPHLAGGLQVHNLCLRV